MVRYKRKQKLEDSDLPPFPQMQAPPGVVANSLRRADIHTAARVVGLPKLTEAVRLAADHLHRRAYEAAHPGIAYNPYDLTVPRPTKEITQNFGVYILQQRYTLEHYMQDQTPYHQSCVHALHQICDPFGRACSISPPRSQIRGSQSATRGEAIARGASEGASPRGHDRSQERASEGPK